MDKREGGRKGWRDGGREGRREGGTEGGKGVENVASVVKYRFGGPAEKTAGLKYRKQVMTVNKT